MIKIVDCFNISFQMRDTFVKAYDFSLSNKKGMDCVLASLDFHYQFLELCQENETILNSYLSEMALDFYAMYLDFEMNGVDHEVRELYQFLRDPHHDLEQLKYLFLEMPEILMILSDAYVHLHDFSLENQKAFYTALIKRDPSFYARYVTFPFWILEDAIGQEVKIKRK